MSTPSEGSSEGVPVASTAAPTASTTPPATTSTVAPTASTAPAPSTAAPTASSYPTVPRIIGKTKSGVWDHFQQLPMDDFPYTHFHAFCV
jgi:hypothetical protein